MSAQFTNEQLLRFYIKDTEPKLEMSNDNIQGQGEDANSVIMSEIQRLIDVGNFNVEDTKGNMNNMQTKLVFELQRGFSSVDDSVAIDTAAPIITALQDVSTKLEQYNTTGNISQSQLLSSLTDLQNALLISNVSSTDNTTVIEQLQIIMGGMTDIPMSSSGVPTTVQEAVVQALLDVRNAKAAAAQKVIDDTTSVQKVGR
jgi:hypothetical protein